MQDSFFFTNADKIFCKDCKVLATDGFIISPYMGMLFQIKVFRPLIIDINVVNVTLTYFLKSFAKVTKQMIWRGKNKTEKSGRLII